MCLIATPISHLFENENAAREIIAVSDCLEVRQRSLHTNWPNQRLFHIDIDLIHPWGDETKNYLFQAFNNKPELELITFQATRCYKSERIKNGMFQPKGEKISREKLLNYAVENTTWLRTIVDESIKIGIENNNYYPSSAYDIVTEPDFISKVINQNDLYLLLDIAHAMVTAHNLQTNYKNYIESLPVEKLIQLHICKPYLPVNGTALDAHNAPDREMDQQVQELVKKYPTIKFLTIEFYKDYKILIKSINSLTQTLSR